MAAAREETLGWVRGDSRPLESVRWMDEPEAEGGEEGEGLWSLGVERGDGEPGRDWEGRLRDLRYSWRK